MKYISGIHALNLECSLDTCGDWHTSALQWDKLQMKESSNSIFKDWGIEKCNKVPKHDGVFNIANTLRALLDLLDDGNFSIAQGMRNDFICNDIYTPIIFEKALLLKSNSNWEDIDKFLEKEYMMQWINYKETQHE